MKRILSFTITLVMLLALIPALPAFAASYGVYIGTTQVTDANMNDVLADGGSVRYVPGDPARLIFNNADITFTTVTGIMVGSGGATEIELIGTSTLDFDATVVPAVGEMQVNGIFSNGALHFIGIGSLSVTAPANRQTQGMSFGIMCRYVELSGGATVFATSSDAEISFGFFSPNQLTLRDDSVLVGTGGDGRYSVGVLAGQNLLVLDRARLTGESGDGWVQVEYPFSMSGSMLYGVDCINAEIRDDAVVRAISGIGHLNVFSPPISSCSSVGFYAPGGLLLAGNASLTAMAARPTVFDQSYQSYAISYGSCAPVKIEDKAVFTASGFEGALFNGFDVQWPGEGYRAVVSASPDGADPALWDGVSNLYGKLSGVKWFRAEPLTGGDSSNGFGYVPRDDAPGFGTEPDAGADTGAGLPDDDANPNTGAFRIPVHACRGVIA